MSTKALEKNDIVSAPYGDTGKRTKVKVLEVQAGYAKVQYLEKKAREELGNKPFLIQTKNLKKIAKVGTNANNIKPDEWVLQNMKQFPEWINKVFLPYRVKETVNKKSNKWEHTTYQKFVRDYLAMDSPYRGLLLYHGLGSGKTCTSIAVAENLKTGKNVVVLSPASLRSNYIHSLKTDCGVTAYKNNEDLLKEKYTFISYNASNTLDQLRKISTLDNHTIVIDEVHNLISMMVTKSKKGPELYKMLMEAKNLKIVALSGTPIINYPFEVALLANILRGYLYLPMFYIKQMKNAGGLEYQANLLKEKIQDLGDVEFVDVSQRYLYVYLRVNPAEEAFDEMIRKILKTAADFGVQIDYIETKQFSLYPEDEDEFRAIFLEETQEGEYLKNVDLLKRRMLGIISYYRGGKSIYYPTVNPTHFIEVPMSDYQYQEYKKVREVERDKEKAGAMQKLLGKVTNSKSKNGAMKKVSSLFRVFSREFSNFVFPPDIERPFVRKFIHDAIKKKLEKKANKSNKAAAKLEELEKENKRAEGNELTAKDKSLIEVAIKQLAEKKDIYLKDTPEGLQKYSPKMAKMLQIIDNSPGLVFVYSAFRALEGIGIFALVLEANGWKKFDPDYPDRNRGTPKFAIYSGAEDEVTREKIRAVYNSPENKYGSELKALLATSAGAEGIDLKNIRQVHIMEPYWHDVRISQVIGRANRFMSHVELPEKDRIVDVYRYTTVMTEDQSKVDPEKESTDQYIYGVALKKLRVTDEIKKTMKEIAVDCTLNAVDNEKDIKCFTFGVDAQGLAYKADIKADMVYGKTELATKTVKKSLQPMFLDGENRLIFADKKKKLLCYFNNKTCKEPLKEPPTNVRKVAVDMETLEVFDIASAKYGNPVKLGEVDERGVMI